MHSFPKRPSTKFAVTSSYLLKFASPYGQFTISPPPITNYSTIDKEPPVSLILLAWKLYGALAGFSTARSCGFRQQRRQTNSSVTSLAVKQRAIRGTTLATITSLKRLGSSQWAGRGCGHFQTGRRCSCSGGNRPELSIYFDTYIFWFRLC